MTAATKRCVNGLLLLDKPLGLSSNAALQRVKRLFHAAKAGHTGSLDPLATGMLPICLGEATKFSAYLLDGDKRYEVVAKLGEQTTTGDVEGEVIASRVVPDISLEDLQRVLANFRGEVQQVPPMFSALKHQGQPLYRLARQGKCIDRPPRAVRIDELILLSYDQPLLSLAVSCSKGTYIRSLVEDIGEALGCGAHVLSLRRVGVGGFKAEQMQVLSQLQQRAEAVQDIRALDGYLLPLELMLQGLPRWELSDLQTQQMRQGKRISIDDAQQSGTLVLVNHACGLVGLGEVCEGILRPKRLLAS